MLCRKAGSSYVCAVLAYPLVFMGVFLGLLAVLAPGCGDDSTPEPRPDRGFRLPVPPDETDAGTNLHPCGLRPESSSAMTLEIYRSKDEWAARLEGCVRTVSFDDVEVGAAPVLIATDRYAASGLVLTSADQGGQFVHTDFGLPADFPPVSAPNIFAPGPENTATSPGGHRTFATFLHEGTRANVAGFGAYFIDTDYPEIKLSGLTAYDGQRRLIGPFTDTRGPSGSQLFLGVVSVLNGEPVAGIHEVEIGTGDGWVGAASLYEVVALDDVMFGIPAGF